MTGRITTAQMCGVIEKHFGKGGEKYSVLFEVRNAMGFSANRSIDAVVMSLWPSLGLELMGMEIKASRSDWLRELKDPKKSSDVFPYFDRWYLVAPDDVARMDEIPAPWGWMAPDGDKLRIIRPAEKNTNLREIDRGFLGALLRQTSRVGDAEIALRVERMAEAQERDFDKRVEQQVQTRLYHREEIVKDVEAFEESSGIKIKDGWTHSATEVGRALKLVLNAGVVGSYQGIKAQAAAARAYAEKIEKAAVELGFDPTPDVPKDRKSRSALR